MGRTDFAILETQRIAKEQGVRFYRPGPADKAYAGTRYEARMPLSDKVLFVVGVIGVIAAIVFNNYH